MLEAAMATPSNRTWAYRITLSYHEKDVTLQSATRIEMIVPPSIHFEGSEKEAGAWFTVDDARGRPLYRRPMGNPFGGVRTMLGGEREFTHVEHSQAEGLIELLAPDLPAAASLTIHASEMENSRAKSPAAAVKQIRWKDITGLAERKGAR
jgi:hypothetical protein